MISGATIGHDNFSKRFEQLQIEENAISTAQAVVTG